MASKKSSEEYTKQINTPLRESTHGKLSSYAKERGIPQYQAVDELIVRGLSANGTSPRSDSEAALTKLWLVSTRLDLLAGSESVPSSLMQAADALETRLGVLEDRITGDESTKLQAEVLRLEARNSKLTKQLAKLLEVDEEKPAEHHVQPAL